MGSMALYLHFVLYFMLSKNQIEREYKIMAKTSFTLLSLLNVIDNLY